MSDETKQPTRPDEPEEKRKQSSAEQKAAQKNRDGAIKNLAKKLVNRRRSAPPHQPD